MDERALQPENLIRGFYILASAALLAGSSVSNIQKRFYLYGARQSYGDVPSSNSGSSRSDNIAKSSGFLDLIKIPNVPHSWFSHFYALSMTMSAFWGYQILLKGRLLSNLLDQQSPPPVDHPPQMSLNQVVIVWLLMCLQGCRRFYECIALYRPTTAKMPIPHYFMGMGFYLVMSITIWVEGRLTIQLSTFPLRDLTFQVPSFEFSAAAFVFLFASSSQHSAHKYLASLPKYSLPQDQAFRLVLCPHYTFECLIYLSLAVVAAPDGRSINRTIFAASIFVTVNLGITALSTKKWYINKFGVESVGSRCRMVPYIF